MNMDSVSIQVIEKAAAEGRCELCGADFVPMQSTVVVQHAHGGRVQFAACDRCTRAMERLRAAIGSEGRVTRVLQNEAGGRAAGVHEPSPLPDVLSAHVLAEVEEHIIGPDGVHYLAAVCGGPRPDGMWAGWIEFRPLGPGGIRRTGQETTQSNRDDLVYWTSGLGPAFFEGAFARAQ
jgi:hypothetical protein